MHSKGCDSWTSQDVISDYTLKLIESLSQTDSHLESFTSINDFSWKLCQLNYSRKRITKIKILSDRSFTWIVSGFGNGKLIRQREW